MHTGWKIHPQCSSLSEETWAIIPNIQANENKYLYQL